MRTKRLAPIQAKKAYAFLVDGETEAWYLQMLRKNEPLLNVSIKPELPTKKTLKAQYDRVCELEKEYDKVFWIIDLDTVRQETKEAAKGHDNALQELQSLMKKAAANKNIVVVINNPCLEFWFLLHFQYTEKTFTNCDSAKKQLQILFPEYEKTERFFKQDNDIYRQLKPRLKQAITNAEKIPPFDIRNTKNDAERSLSEMMKIFKELKIA